MMGKPGRGNKINLVCNACKKPCLPKNGDWQAADNGGQVFICLDCRRKAQKANQQLAPKLGLKSGAK